MTVEVELGEKTLNVLGALAEALRLRSGGVEKTGSPEEWMKMADICRFLSISPPTVRKRVQAGQIEARYFGEKNPRYRIRNEELGVRSEE